MKTIFLTAMISLLSLANVALAASESTTHYQGQARIKMDYSHISIFGEDYSVSSMEKIQINAEFKELESGRGTIRLTSNEINKCNGLSTLVYAEQDGFGVYELYASKEAWTNGEKLGTATKKASSIQISFSADRFYATSVGRKGTRCVFDLGNNFYSELSLKK